MSREGQLKINSENLFPIIKKWLYSDKDIFLREIVANSCDAISKLRRLVSIGEAEEQAEKPRIDIVLDKGARTLAFSDNGIGMTDEEVEKYITQIAFSGAKDFIEQYKDKTDADAGIIGHFGLGFYSAYMVADTVDIDTLSYKTGAKAVHWSSDGNATYEIGEGGRDKVGTTVTLHISEDAGEFLEEWRLRQIIRRYCGFMPYEIYFSVIDPEKEKEKAETTENTEDSETEAKKPEETPVNDTEPLWKKAPKDCTKEEYEKFYRDVFNDYNPPLFWIHLNVDYPFNLKGILYFPKQTNEMDVVPGEVKLYCNQVYIADNIKEVVPEFLLLLKGVIDCPDLPLNVSRSFLQNDGDVAKISKHITKKVADKLCSMFANSREEYESYWDDIAPFIKFGCIRDEKFYERMKDALLLKGTDGKYYTVSEYPTGEDKKVYYTSDPDVQSQYIKLLTAAGKTVVVLNHVIDTHFITFLEYNLKDYKFQRVDSDIEAGEDGADETAAEDIVAAAKPYLDEKLTVKAQALSDASTPAVLLLSEQSRRLKEMVKMYGMSGFNPPDDEYTLILNTTNSAVKKLPSLPDDRRELVSRYVYDLAALAHKKLSAEELNAFIERSGKLLEMVSGV